MEKAFNPLDPLGVFEEGKGLPDPLGIFPAPPGLLKETEWVVKRRNVTDPSYSTWKYFDTREEATAYLMNQPQDERRLMAIHKIGRLRPSQPAPTYVSYDEKRQSIIASLAMALPDEDKASKDYALLAQQMREIGRDEFARQLESIANQEAGHFVNIGYMLEQLKRG